MNKNIIVANNIRSAYNVGSLFRICDAFNFDLIIQGISPRPALQHEKGKELIKSLNDEKKLRKSGLDGFDNINWKYFQDETDVIKYLLKHDYTIISIENNVDHEIDIKNYKFANKLKYAIVMGSEVNGVSEKFLKTSKSVLKLSMQGKGKSLNVSVCAGIVAYLLNS